VADIGTAVTAIGGAGAVGTFVVVIGYLLRQNAVDRRDTQDIIDKANRRTDDMADRLALARTQLDEERDRRRNAEDALARHADVLNRLQNHIDRGGDGASHAGA
jgi:uncharacterized membrane protein YccC